MNKTIQNNTIKIVFSENFPSMLAYFYLMVIEFASNGLFVPSINPPEDNNFLPAKSFFNKEHILEYSKKIIFKASENSILLTFETINDAKAFNEEIEKNW